MNRDIRRKPLRCTGAGAAQRIFQEPDGRLNHSWLIAEQELLMSLASLIATGTKVWLDGVAPEEIEKNHAWGITGATSNPAIVSKIIGRGHFDGRISELIQQGLTDDQIAWELDDELVKSAQNLFLPAWERTKGNDGYVSFELDPLIEHEAASLDRPERVR
jgi:transaldolase